MSKPAIEYAYVIRQLTVYSGQAPPITSDSIRSPLVM
jgi:hypothetical protein